MTPERRGVGQGRRRGGGRDRQHRQSRAGRAAAGRPPGCRALAAPRSRSPAPPGQPVGRTEQTLRLITQENVVATPAAISPRSLTAPPLPNATACPSVADSVALNITGRGFQWFFRTGPFGPISRSLHRFPQGRRGREPRSTIAIVNENTEYGTSARRASSGDERQGLKLDFRIPYNANCAEVSAQVLQLREVHRTS